MLWRLIDFTQFLCNLFQRLELVEGGAYSIAGLMPSCSDFDILHLHGGGSSTKWLPLSSNAREQFRYLTIITRRKKKNFCMAIFWVGHVLNPYFCYV